MINIAPHIKVLLIEENANIVHQVRKLLVEASPIVSAMLKAEILHTERLEPGLAYLAAMRFDVVLMNPSLPDSQGAEAFLQVKAAAPTVPVVILSERDDEETAVQIMQQGAQGFILQERLDAHVLASLLLLAVEQKQLRSNLEQTASALQSSETSCQQAKRELSLKAAKLETRNAELDAFARTTAHQIQGLLSQMIGYTSYLEMHYGPTMDDEAQEVLRHILRSGHKMSNVLSELLLLAYVEKEDIPFTALDMGRIVSETQKRMAFEIEEQKGELLQPDSWPTILGYGSWIEEAWVNYISNGLKYGGTPPQIKLGWDAMGNGMIRFWVKDDGQGIEPGDQKRLFKPHTRLHQMRATGEGLGLSIVRRIIQKCGGEVGVESILGEGSTFWFTLPIAEEDKVQV